MKDLIRIAMTGHVDHGKSTLIGRLLIETHSLPKGELKKTKQISKEYGKDTQLAYLADQLKEERNNNITLDTSEIFLKTPKKDFCIIDTPGHLELIKNMITGATHAQAAMLIIDGKEGIQEQTKQHATLLNLLSIKTIIILINKMDLINYNETRFLQLKTELQKILKSLDLTSNNFIPISASQAVNITTLSRKTPWYHGQTVLGAMQKMHIPQNKKNKSFRMPIQGTYQINNAPVIMGRIASGKIHAGQSVIVYPSKIKTTITSILVYGKKAKSAQEGESIGLSFCPEVKIKRGDVLCSDDQTRKPSQEFLANVFWISSKPLSLNDTFQLCCATFKSNGLLKNIDQKIDPISLKNTKSNFKKIVKNEAALVKIKVTTPLFMEEFLKVQELGRFTIERDHVAQGMGLIFKIL